MDRNRRALIWLIVVLLLNPVLSGELRGGGGWAPPPPPPLDDYLDRLPAKSFGRIFLELDPDVAPPDGPPPDFEAEMENLYQKFPGTPRENLRQEMGRLLQLARDYYQGPAWSNYFHDLYDLFGLPEEVTDEEIAGYMQWRAAMGRLSVGGREAALERVEEIKAILARTEGPLRAQLLYLAGAMLHRSGERVQSREFFQQVAVDHPETPRAETALFMVARCEFALARINRESWQRPGATDVADAVAAFELYLEKYPEGRFVADSHGWLGGLSFDIGDYPAALKHYIRQIETPGHPEVLKSALFMCERVLSRAIAKDSGHEELLGLVAEHPGVAMGFLYYVLNRPMRGAEDREPISAHVWQQQILPQLAAEVVGRKAQYEVGDWQPAYLAILAHAASAEGDQDRALEIVAMAGDDAIKSDDLAFARSIFFARAGDYRAAIEAFKEFLGVHPESAMADGAKLRLALAYHDEGRSGEALVELLDLYKGRDIHGSWVWAASPGDTVYPPPDSYMEMTQSVTRMNLSGAEIARVWQLMDIIAWFAPVEQLAGLLENPVLDPADETALRRILMRRKLAMENFAAAHRYAPTGEYPEEAIRLEKLTRALVDAGDDPGEKKFTLANAWAESRGKLFAGLPGVESPLDETTTELRRRLLNARALGYSGVAEILDCYDELHHAIKYWLEAADSSGGSDWAPLALLNANEAVPILARRSTYHLERAHETGAAGRSRAGYERLRQAYPDSEAASRAAFWNFDRAPYAHTYLYEISYYPRLDRHRLLRGFRHNERLSNYPEPGHRTVGRGSRDDWNEIGQQLEELRQNAGVISQGELARDAAELLNAIRQVYNDVQQAAVLNLTEDLASFLSEPDLTNGVIKNYIALRFDVWAGSSWYHAPIRPPPVSPDVDRNNPEESLLANVRALAADPVMEPVADYLDFLELALAYNRGILVPWPEDSLRPGRYFPSRNFERVRQLARTFLDRHPDSTKREAAWLLKTRAALSLARPFYYRVGPIPDDNQQPPELSKLYLGDLSPTDVLGILDAMEEEFPEGRYAADVAILRAETAYRLGDYPTTIRLCLDQLEGDRARDLDDMAAMILGNFFADLSEPDRRPEVLAAIKQTPRVHQALGTFLDQSTMTLDAPLHFMTEFLFGQIPKPEARSAPRTKRRNQ